MLEISFFLADNEYAVTQNVYLYPDDLIVFAERLLAFPATPKDEVVLEAGSPEKEFYAWLKLRAYMYNALGHTALEVSTQQNGESILQRHSQFSVPIEIGALNILAQDILTWIGSNETKLVFDTSPERTF